MPYVSRYILPIFPLLFIFAGVAIDFISTHISKKLPLIFGMVITLFIVVNGDTFTIKPRAFYSVNRDMREVAIIDYDSIFEIIQSKGNLEAGKTAVIDTWPDRVKWYLGENKEYLYTYRWINSPGTVNGLSMSTPFEVNELGEKIITSTGVPPFKLIGELSDLEMAMSKYEYGFIWIDDTSLPQDIQVYVKENFHKELYLESYPPELLENPYSIWPGTLYSWGFETPNPSHSKPTQDILE